MITNKKFALAYRIIALIISISGIITTGIGEDGNFHFSSFKYYTVQSNLLAVVLFSLLIYKTIKSLNDPKEGVSFFPRFTMVCVIDLLLTLAVYWILLAPSAFDMGDGASLFSYSNLTVHLITPLLCFVDYILFAKSGHLKYRDVYAVVIFPLFYVISSSIMGLSGHIYHINDDGSPVHYPYFFLDYGKLGWKVLLYVLGLAAIFLILSHLFYLFDKKIEKPQFSGEKKTSTL